MIELLPQFDSSNIQCLKCNSTAIEVNSILFQGIHVLADCRCPTCRSEFYNTLPIGHTRLFPIQFLKDGSKSVYHPRAEVWLAKPLIESMTVHPKLKVAPGIQRIITARQVVIVNCMDNCFGHVFTKLWNACTLLKNHPGLGVIVIVPINSSWLVPVGAEAWQVDVALAKCNLFLDGLDEFAKSQFKRFDKVFLSHTFTHIDHSRWVDLEALVKRKRFELSDFSIKQICITFNLREDRFWHNSILMDLLYKVMQKGSLQPYFKSLFVLRQNYLVKKTTRLLLKELPNARIMVTGIGKSNHLGGAIIDHRVVRITPETESKWNVIFSQSHVVIGIHGSGMLIPSALAAGFINLTPRYKIPHLAEDSALPYTNRYLHFLGRYLDEYSTPRLVAMHAISMIRDFPYLYINTEQLPE